MSFYLQRVFNCREECFNTNVTSLQQINFIPDKNVVKKRRKSNGRQTSDYTLTGPEQGRSCQLHQGTLNCFHDSTGEVSERRGGAQAYIGFPERLACISSLSEAY